MAQTVGRRRIAWGKRTDPLMKLSILPRLALLVICLGLGLAPAGRPLAAGFPLPLQNAGTWGKSPAAVVADIQTALESSGFLDAVKVADGLAKQIGQGKVPAIDDLAKVIEGDVQNRVNAAVAQATDATQLLAMLDVTALQQLFKTLESTITTPQEFAFTIPGGRLVFRRDLVDVSLCAVIAGPGGARVTLGMSNGKQLGGNPAERFVNPTREPMLFADIALGLAHVQARRKLLAPPAPGPDPALSLQAAIYFKIHDDWVQLRLAGNDPQSLSLSLQFVVGVKAGFSVKLQAEVEGQIILELGVKPAQVASLLHDIGDILQSRLGNLPASSADAAPALAASVFREVFAYLQMVEDSGEGLGELAIRFAGDGGVGLGIWDTGINAASVGAELTLSVPLEAIVSLQGDLLATQFNAGLEISTQLVSFFEAMSENRLSEVELQRQLGLVGRTADEFARAMLGSYAGYLEDIGLHYEMGAYALGDIGQVADQTIPLIVVGTDIPVGKMLVNGINGIPQFVSGVTETAKAMVWTAEAAISAGLNAADQLSLGKIVPPRANQGGYIQRPRGNPPTPPTPTEWEAMAANLLDDVTFSIQFGVIKVEGASLGNLVRLAGGAHEVTTSLLAGAVRSAIAGNEKPLLDALRAAPGQIGNEAKDLLVFNLQNLSIGVSGSLGASGTIGVEAAIGVGASIGFEAELKASLILLALDSDAYDEEDGTLLAGIDFPLELSASAGVSVGEGVEFSAEGGVAAGSSLANLTLKDWGQDLPVPAGFTVAGFEVIDFAGTNRQDGTISGKGWIVLPMGGLVRADHFSMDAAGKIIAGAWSGVVELGPLGEVTVAGGTITDDGLVGKTDLAVGTSILQADFRLRSNGLLFGNAVGSLSLGGVPLANVNVSLIEDGSFAGTARAQIAGATSDSQIRLRLLNQPSARLTSVSILGGVSAQLDLQLSNAGATGTAMVDAFGQPVGFDVAILPRSGLTGSAVARLATPWGLAIDSNLQLDATGVHGAGKTRILGSEFTSSNLRLRPDGRITGSFNGTLAVDGYQLGLTALEIRDDALQGRTTLGVAGRSALELQLTIDRGGVIGTFLSNLDLFGAGSSKAWVRITDKIEVFGQLDGDFHQLLESLLRGTLLTAIADAQDTLRREQAKLGGFNDDLAKFDRQLIALRQQILAEQQAAKAAAEAAVVAADSALQSANQELDGAIAALVGASGQLATELGKAEAVFRAANTALGIAQGEVDRINRDIGNLDNWYNRLDAVGKVFFWVGYQASRGTLLAARNVATAALATARQSFNVADAALKDLQRQLANAEALLAAKALKEQLVANARASAEEARRNLTAILGTLADPTLDPRYIALSLGRDAVRKLVAGAGELISLTTSVLGEVTGLVEFIKQLGEASLVKVSQVNFRSTLAGLNNGLTELTVDALVAGQPQRFVIPYDLRTGQNEANLATAARRLSPQLYPDSAWTVSPWTNDGSSGVTPGQTIWAYRFNSTGTTSVGSVPVIGLTGTSPAVSGRFSVQGFVATYPGDQNALTSGAGGSSSLAANFIYGANPGTITFEGLTPGVTYRATVLSVGFDEAPVARNVTFSSAAGERTVEQNTYGNNQGIRIEHTFTATTATHAVTLTPATDATFHLYALALSVEGEGSLTFANWQQTEFGPQAFNPALADDDEDPDRDGLPNFLEYALRSNPQAANRSAFTLPVPVTLPGSVEARQFTLPYQPTSGDMVYRLRHSTNLGTWTDAFRLDLATGRITQLSGVSGTADATTRTMTITITDLSLFAPPSFWSLSVEKP